MNLSRILALALPVALAATGTAQTVQLRFKPPVGKTATYTMSMSMSMSGGMIPKPMAMTQTVPMTMKVVSRQGNATTIQTKMGQAKISVPADSPMAGMKAMMEKQMSGNVSTTTVDELGNLKNVSASGASAAMTRQLGGMMQGAQGIAFPKKALRVGDAWTASMDMNKLMGGMMGGGMKMTGPINVTYKLLSVSGGVATISIKMKGDTTMNMGAQSMKIGMNSNGSVKVDAATGLMKSMSTTTDTNMTMPQGSMKQHMVVSMK